MARLRVPEGPAAPDALTRQEVDELHELAAAMRRNKLGADGTPIPTPEQAARLRELARCADRREFTDEAFWWGWGLNSRVSPYGDSLPAYVVTSVNRCRAHRAWPVGERAEGTPPA